MTIPVDGNLDLQSVNKIVNSPTPTSAADVANKAYVDATQVGIIYKTEVAAASVGANISLTAPGAALDGVSLSNPSRILLKDQATGSQNGLWVWTGASTTLTRPTDFASGATEEPGAAVFVAAGTTNASALWVMNNTSNVTVDTTAQTWAQAGGTNLSFTAPLTKTGSVVTLNNGSPLPIVDGGTASSTAAGARAALSAVGKYSTIIGDGTTTSFTITHNLGVAPVQVQVFDMATGSLELASVTITSVNACTVAFGSAPGTASGTTPGSGVGKMVVVVG